MRAVGRLQQLRSREDDHFVDLSHLIFTAATVCRILLLEYCLRTKTQGNYYRAMLCSRGIGLCYVRVFVCLSVTCRNWGIAVKQNG